MNYTAPTNERQRLLFIVQLLSRVRLFVTPWTVAGWASPSFNISQSLLKLLSVESVMPSNHLILCHPLLRLPSTFPSNRVFSNELALHIRWPSIGASASASACFVVFFFSGGKVELGLPCCAQASSSCSE